MLQIPIILDKLVMNYKKNSKTYSLNLHVEVREVVKKLNLELWLLFERGDIEYCDLRQRPG